MRPSISGESVAGPNVATILVFRIILGALPGAFRYG